MLTQARCLCFVGSQGQGYLDHLSMLLPAVKTCRTALHNCEPWPVNCTCSSCMQLMLCILVLHRLHCQSEQLQTIASVMQSSSDPVTCLLKVLVTSVCLLLYGFGNTHQSRRLAVPSLIKPLLSNQTWSVRRLLHYNVEEARRIVAAPAPAITRFAEEQSPEQRDRIFDELNTLAVVYRQPSSAFTNAAPAHKEVCRTFLYHACYSLLYTVYVTMFAPLVVLLLHLDCLAEWSSESSRTVHKG